MLRLTVAAADHLNTILTSKSAPKRTAIRIIKGDSGHFEIQADVPKMGDISFEHEGRTVLVIDKKVSELLGDRVLDLVSRPEGTILALSP
ncbi:MAG: hypothetical protein JXP73_03460 [Deltaproteobacteria bacterium]|jgi:Fe-S cluster assembly iron-binding protein IscA|nr:hypothetical protein [Deltaproteobacteria bacterium]